MEKENEKLKNELAKLKENQLNVNEYEQAIKNLSDRLEKLLK